MRQPQLPSTIMSTLSPTALRTASSVLRSSRTSWLWKRSLKALKPSATICLQASTRDSRERQLAGGGVGADLVGAAAEELVDGLARLLADDVPEGDLDRPGAADEERHRAQVVDVLLHVERVLALQEEAGHVPADGHAAGADAGDPLVGLDLDDVEAVVDGRERLPRRVEGLRHLVFVEVGLDGGDLHGVLPRERIGCQQMGSRLAERRADGRDSSLRSK